VFLCLAVVLAACTATTTGQRAPDVSEPLAADLRALRTDNGLLYPPELWGVLDRSSRSEVLRNQALIALGEQVRWSLAPDALYQALLTETDALSAASLMVAAGLDPPLSPATITSWVAREQPVTVSGGIDRLWRAVTVAVHSGLPVDLDAATLEQLPQRLAHPSPLQQRQAADLLAAGEQEVGQLPAPAAWLHHLAATDLGHDPQRLASELNSWVALHHRSPGFTLDRDYWQPLLARAPDSDDIYTYLVQAFATAGDLALAREVAMSFDERRLRGDGSVLEPPMFVGSVGSTFRMLRFLTRSPGALAALAGAEDLVADLEPLLDRDTSHRVAGTASIHLLRGAGAVPLAERQAAIDAATADAGVREGVPMALEPAMGWVSVAEYAIELGVPMQFPGLTEQALRQLTALDPHGDDALYAVARLVVVLAGTGHEGASELPMLTDHLREQLSAREPAKTSSLLLFAGSLALLQLGQPAPFPEPVLASEIERRSGNCLGGFQSFVRELRQPNTPCNVEATRYAQVVREAIDGRSTR
jgi:hypothetical protein